MTNPDAPTLLDAARLGYEWMCRFRTSNDQERAELRGDIRRVKDAIAATEGGEVGYRPISEAPKDGTAIAATELYRWLAYKPGAPKSLLRRGGRWQRHNGYGWENAEPPEMWLPGAVVKGKLQEQEPGDG